MKNIFFESTTRSLRENKPRAIATLIGVVISVAMATAILFLASSFYHFELESVKKEVGSWSVAVEKMNKDMKEEIEEKGISYGEIKGVAYALLGDSANPQKPFLFLANIDEKLAELSEFNIIEGRMPKTKNEIVLPEHLSTNGGINYSVGDVIQLDLGIRVDIYGGEELTQVDGYNTGTEIFVKNSEKTFTVVGISKRPVVEPYMAAGYTAIVKDQFHISDSNMSFFDENDYTEVKSIAESHYQSTNKIIYNKPLLSINGDLEGKNRRGIIFAFTLGFLSLIVLGGCILMYNTFIISLRERRRQYEIFASVGATENQLRRMALYEGAFFATIGIPLGMIIGTIATYVTLFFAGDNLAEAMISRQGETMRFYVESELVLLALIVSVIVVQISIIVPAYKAGKTLPVKEKTYQYMSSKTQKEVAKANKNITKQIGIEGMLAIKNFRRSRKQYRSTVVSLVMSMVLFITASGMTVYAQGAIDALVGDESSYDIIYEGESTTEVKTAYKALAKADGVTDSTCVYMTRLSAEIGTALMDYNLFIVDDETFKKYIGEKGEEEEKYFNSEKPVAVAVSTVSIYNAQNSRMEERKIFKDETRPDRISGMVEGVNRDIVIGRYIEKMPTELFSSIGSPTIILSQSGGEKWIERLSDEAFVGKVMFQSSNATQSYDAMKVLCKKNGLIEDRLENVKNLRESANSLLMSIRSFSYIFILLIAIIAVTNAFNTISASIDTRKIEYITLLALGMEPAKFKRMIFYECILLGGKTLLYGIPISLISVFIIFKSISKNLITGYVIPIGSLIVSIICVIAVVINMVGYIERKVKEKSPAEVLKKNNF